MRAGPVGKTRLGTTTRKIRGQIEDGPETTRRSGSSSEISQHTQAGTIAANSLNNLVSSRMQTVQGTRTLAGSSTSHNATSRGDQREVTEAVASTQIGEAAVTQTGGNSAADAEETMGTRVAGISAATLAGNRLNGGSAVHVRTKLAGGLAHRSTQQRRRLNRGHVHGPRNLNSETTVCSARFVSRFCITPKAV